MKKVFSFCIICLLAVSAMAQNSVWVDLGLPSGTLWKRQNESGFYTYEQAINRFGNLPGRYHFVELINECTWIWMGDYGYKVVGPNGNSITFPAAGRRKSDGDMYGVGIFGAYWSFTPNDYSGNAWSLWFDSRGAVKLFDFNRCYEQSVRLVQ